MSPTRLRPSTYSRAVLHPTRRLALCCVALLCAGLPCPPAHSATGGTAGTAPVRLELIPFTDPLATLIALDKDGHLRCFRFYPSRLVVASHGERLLTPAERKLVARALAAAPLERALRATDLAGDGLIQGDQFRLGLPESSHLPREVWGFVDQAAPALHSFIDALLHTLEPPQRLAELALARSYVRARQVEPARAEELRRTTPVRIAALSDFSPELQGLIGRVVRDPLLFHPLPPARRTELAAQRSLGDEVFVHVGGLGVFQLRLYSVE